MLQHALCLFSPSHPTSPGLPRNWPCFASPQDYTCSSPSHFQLLAYFSKTSIVPQQADPCGRKWAASVTGAWKQKAGLPINVELLSFVSLGLQLADFIARWDKGNKLQVDWRPPPCSNTWSCSFKPAPEQQAEGACAAGQGCRDARKVAIFYSDAGEAVFLGSCILIASPASE